ncbi:DedA family protein [Rhizobium leucaenae]|uniref:Membrane protein DedA with SNARE-associated domain n=1 Tax=Rhizobium leucaenae TaxID=29450 RepID=A0A7W6ZQG9_9HYPH|nr:DedA family protein [Rhizobium leucaenae]MBB4566719.1 membrane protein DedA with SNARE-associated domain [Rhizobium leucaenae]MBB6301386.1 membrane protein DedA with SNARE-associated domain [Rhizobium leucaenae]
MTIELLIARYGLLAIFLGAAIEGETMVILGGVFSHRHLMTYWNAAAAACAGSFIADQTLFFIGRYARHYPRVQKIIAKPAFARVTHLLERHPTGFIFSFRFIYGLRAISPVAIGMSGVSAIKFALINAAAALIWGLLFTGIGYLFGQGIEQAFGHLPLHHHVLIAAGIIIVLLLIMMTFRKSRPA